VRGRVGVAWGGGGWGGGGMSSLRSLPLRMAMGGKRLPFEREKNHVETTQIGARK